MFIYYLYLTLLNVIYINITSLKLNNIYVLFMILKRFKSFEVIWKADMSLMLACFEMLALIKFIEIDNAWLQRHIYRFFWITLELIYN